MRKLWVIISLMVMITSSLAQDLALLNDSVNIRRDSLALRSIELDELVVKESLVNHSTKSDTYKVTEAMRRGIDGTMQLLGRLPGVVYDNVKNSVTVHNNSNVQIIVDGNQVGSSYLNAIPLDRIDKVEVIYMPSARYTTAGYRYVIDIKLKPEYRGHDIYVGNFMMVSAGNNGDDVVANEQPQMMYMYSGDKVDFNVGYGWG